MQNKTSPFAYFILFIFLTALITPSMVHASWEIDRNGHINYVQNGHVLGDSIDISDDSGKGKSGNSGSGSSSSGSSQATPKASTESKATDSPQSSSGTVATTKPVATVNPTKKAESKGSDDSFGISDKVLQQLDDLDAAAAKEDVSSSGIEKEKEVDIESSEDGLRLSGPGEDSSVEDLMLEDDVLTLEDKEGNDQIKIASASGNSLVLFKSDVGAKTKLPVSVNMQTNVLSVSTPDGNKTITLLPNKAIEGLQKDGVIDRIEGESGATLGSKELAGVTNVFPLEMADGQLVYRIHGVKNKKVLWFIPVSIEKDLTISAANGAVIKTEKSFTGKVLDKISG